MKLTDRKIQLTNPPYNGRITLTDGNGLCLRITSTNKRSWSLQYRSNGRLLRYTIGSYPDVSLKVARQLASELRLNISKGQDPQQAKLSARTTDKPTVEACSNEYADSYLKPNPNGHIPHDWKKYTVPDQTHTVPNTELSDKNCPSNRADSSNLGTVKRHWGTGTVPV